MMINIHLVCLDPDAAHYLGQMYYNLTSKDGSLALQAILSNSATHLLSLGRIPKSTFIVLQQQAFKALRCSLKKFDAELSMLTSDGMLLHGHHMPFSSLDDDAIVGSLLLVDDEIILPNDSYGGVRLQFLLFRARIP